MAFESKSLGVDPRCEACGMDFEVIDVQISKSNVSELEIRAICPRGKCSTGPVTIRAQITDIERGEDNEKDETVES